MAHPLTENITDDIEALKAQLVYRQSLQEITNELNLAEDLDTALEALKDRILSLFNSERMTIYLIDRKSQELYSRFKIGTELSEIRIPINTSSMAGYAAAKGKSLNVSDVYDEAEIKSLHLDLAFDKNWDEKSGYRTTQVLTAPIQLDGTISGVLQIINRKDGSKFTRDDEDSAQEIVKILAIAFQARDRRVRSRPTNRFGYLTDKGLLTQEELESTIIKARQAGKDVEQILMKGFKISKEDIGEGLGQFYNCRFLSIEENPPIPGDLLHNLKKVYLRSNLWVPLSKDQDGTIIILIDDPHYLSKRDMIQTLLKTDQIEYCVGLKEDILKLIDYFFAEGEDAESIGDLVAQLDLDDDAYDESEEVSESDSAVAQLVNKIINDGYSRGASDIHLEPYPGKRPMKIRFRIDGACSVYQSVPYQYKKALVSRIKIMSDLDITERRLPQDGKIQFKKFGGRDIELRVATFPVSSGLEDVVMRILASGKALTLDDMGFSERNQNTFERILEMPYGIALVVGPTGSGKTTTLHSAVGYINTPERKIWTAEDPVEITQDGLRQVQVQPKIGFTFARAMRAFLRGDPDVIMVGEMRDKETCEIGIEASLTGHLVLSTLHTNSAPETIVRLLDMGMDPFNFADALLCILAQRLFRTLCKKCKEPYHPKEDEYQDLVTEYGPEHFDKTGIEYSSELTLYGPKGCQICSQTGYRGRMALHELLEGTDEIKRLIQHKNTIQEIREQALRDGMTTLKQDGISKVFQGYTDIRQVRSVCIK